MNQQVNSSSAAAPYGMAGPNAPLPVPPTKTISIESIPNHVRQRFPKGMCNVFGSQGVMEGIRQYKAYGVPASQLVIGLPWYGYGMPRDLLPTE